MRAGTWALISIAVAVIGTSGAQAEESDHPWARAAEPAPGQPQAIGGYSAGCVQGAVELPLAGPGFRVMRPWRNRHYGHEVLVSFVRDLAKRIVASKLPRLALGDLGQPRGGPAPSGHASHQSGLDIDIWFQPKNPRAKRPREIDMVDHKRKKPSPAWKRRHARMVEMAARDPRVARIFVNPVLKLAMCKANRGKDTSWLRVVRPWFGHSEHFHVRLRCPDGDEHCVDQAPIGEGDGCEDIERVWLSKKAADKRKKTRSGYRSKIGSVPTLPEPCLAIQPD